MREPRESMEPKDDGETLSMEPFWNWLTMESIDITYSGPDMPSCPPCVSDEDLLSGYCNQMISDGVSWRERESRYGTARHFLDWWGNHHQREHSSTLAAITDCIGNDSSDWKLRETFLRQACPDRDLRASERANLNLFLHYIACSQSLTTE